jgi:ABC-type glycerol-3-phosphate transport system substrate-binding protein
MRSKLFQFTLVLVILSMVLAACSTTTATPTTSPVQVAAATDTVAPTATTAPTATAVPPTKTPAPTAVTINNPPNSSDQVDAIQLQGKKIQVVFWHNRPQADQDFLQKMLDEFNASNPYGITAKAEMAGASYNDLYTKVSSAIQAGQPPSMSLAYQNQAAFYRSQGAVIDLNPFIHSFLYGLSAADLKDYYPTFLASDANPQYKGETLGFPTQRSMEVLFYNADWLKRLGYDAPPTTWDQFYEMSCKASQEAGKFGFAYKHDASPFASQVFSRGGQILADDGLSYVFNSQAGVDTVAFIQKLFANKCAVEVPASESNGDQTRFGKGSVLFTIGSSSGLPYYQSAVSGGAKFAWNIALVPNTGKATINLYGASISVYKTTPDQELASWLVIKFLGAKEQTTRWAIQTGYMPVRQSAQADVIAGFKLDTKKWGPVADTYAKLFDWIQYAKIESPVAGYDPVRAVILDEVLEPVIKDAKADPKALLDAAVTKANGILKDNAPK